MHSQTAENPDIGELLETCPLAAALFFLSWARCDLYGILPAEPRRYRSIVAPAAMLPPATVAEALDALEAHGFIRRYTTSDGTALLHILTYNKWQEVRWANGVGPPENELPPWWEPPVEFLDWIVSDKCLRWTKRASEWWALRERYCSATVVQQLRYRCATLNKTQDTVHITSTDSAPPAGAADALDAVASPPGPPAEPEEDLVLVPPVDPQTPAPKRTRKKTDRDLVFEACLTACRVDPATLDPAAYATYAKAMGKLVAAHSLEELTAWAEQTTADGGRTLGTGAAPEIKVPALVRRELTADTWAGTFASARTKAKHNGQRFIDHSVNGRIYERDWTEDMHGTVALYSSQGLWDDERGMTTIDPRHPSRQHPVAGA